MAGSQLNRRGFLHGTLASVPLVGTIMATGANQPEEVSALKGSRNSVVIPTHEWAGNIEERLDFPSDWKVNVSQMAGHDAPVLDEQQIGAKLAQTIGTKSLRELASGKQRVVITFDDTTRPTPTYAVAPWLVSELQAVGIADSNILFLGSFGTHRAMTVDEVRKKLGPGIVKRFAWTNHNCFYNHKDVGETSFKNRILINQTFMSADLKVCVSGIKVHGAAGYGGGAKAVLPGVAALSTVHYNHLEILPHTKTAGPGHVFKNECRLDMIEAARLAQVDFSVQIIYNQKLKPTAVFGGDIAQAHYAGSRVAAQHYCCPTYKNADVVISNAYPQCSQADHALGWFNRSLRDGGTGVLIVQHPSAVEPIHYLYNRETGRSGASYFDLTASQLERKISGKGGPENIAMIVYSQYTDRAQMNYYPRGTHFCDQWVDVIKLLQERHKGSVQVAVYPYGGLQHKELELDG